MRTLFYCQHSIGIGHLMRTVRLANASLANGPVGLICGGQLPESLTFDTRIDVCALPALSTDKSHRLINTSSMDSIEDVLRVRAEAANEFVRKFQPDALVVEMFPFGRKKFAGEIISIIEASREAGVSKVFASVRDVLVTTRSDQSRYDQRAVEWLNAHFDVLLIHSDPSLIGLDETFSAFDKIRIPCYYTGYIGSVATPDTAQRSRQIVVSAGGGRVGQGLTQTALTAAPLIKEQLGLEMLVITGPLSNTDGVPPGIETTAKTVRFISNFPKMLAQAAVSVSQCGYNTAVEVLQTGTTAVFTPFETSTENEQLRRAEILSGHSLSVLLRECHLSPDTLLGAISQAVETRNNSDVTSNIDLAGAERSRELIREVHRHA